MKGWRPSHFLPGYGGTPPGTALFFLHCVQKRAGALHASRGSRGDLPPPRPEFLHCVQDDKWGMVAKEGGILEMSRKLRGVLFELVGIATPAVSGLAMGARYFVYRFTKMIFAAAPLRVPSLRSG